MILYVLQLQNVAVEWPLLYSLIALRDLMVIPHATYNDVVRLVLSLYRCYYIVGLS